MGAAVGLQQISSVGLSPGEPSKLTNLGQARISVWTTVYALHTSTAISDAVPRSGRAGHGRAGRKRRSRGGCFHGRVSRRCCRLCCRDRDRRWGGCVGWRGSRSGVLSWRWRRPARGNSLFLVAVRVRQSRTIPVNTYWPSTVPRCGRRPGADVGRSPRGCARQCWHRPSADLGQYRRRFRPALVQRRAHSGAVLARSKCRCGQSGAGCVGTHDCVRMSAV